MVSLMEGTPKDTTSTAPRQNGAAIRALREKDGCTQTAFAKAVGIRQASLSQIENEAVNAGVATLNLIARALHVPVAAITRNRIDVAVAPGTNGAAALWPAAPGRTSRTG